MTTAELKRQYDVPTMKTIILRSGSGHATHIVNVTRIVNVGLCPSHNGDGSYVKAYATDGRNFYETKSKGGGWRRASCTDKAARALRSAE